MPLPLGCQNVSLLVLGTAGDSTRLGKTKRWVKHAVNHPASSCIIAVTISLSQFCPAQCTLTESQSDVCLEAALVYQVRGIVTTGTLNSITQSSGLFRDWLILLVRLLTVPGVRARCALVLLLENSSGILAFQSCSLMPLNAFRSDVLVYSHPRIGMT
jgi:hypothetical protein